MGILIDNPEPLRNCPTLRVWEQRRGQVYLAFIDETFLQFFELNSRGYFCHAAVGIPESEYGALCVEMTAILDRYRELLVPELHELKHTEFKRIPFRERWEFATRIRDVLHGHGGYISAFYPPANSLLLELVRVDLLLHGNDVQAVPADHKDLLVAKAAETKATWSGPGMSAVIRRLLLTPVSGLLHFAAGLDLRIRIVYDPREPKEDKAVAEAISDMLGGLLQQ